MRKNLLFLIFLFGLLIGAQKNEGLILQKKTFTALIPFKSRSNLILVEANPPLFAKERLPLKNKLSSWFNDKLEDEIPPITSSLTIFQFFNPIDFSG